MSRRVHPELLERLAAEYVLGTMVGGARRRFERAMAEDMLVAQAALRWQEQLLPLHDAVKPLPAGDALWSRIEGKAFGAARAAPSRQSWWQRLLGPVPAGALAFGLVLGSLGPGLYRQLYADAESAAQLPESYVGVLATAEGKPGLIVSSLRRGKVVDLKRLAPVPLAAGEVLFLWSLDGEGRPQPIGALPAFDARGFVAVPLAQPAEALFQRAVELAVTREAAGVAPTAPAGAYLYRGLCGKLWPPAK